MLLKARRFSRNMISKFYLVIATLYLLLVNPIFCGPAPDSAGMVPQPNGLAYGGIPYGSISGQLSLYYGDPEPILLSDRLESNELQIL